jgi:ferric-dicitrate binding protein FerR (iron transport regulator)
MNKKTKKHIDWSIISRNLSGKLSDSEKEEFKEWLENDSKHKNYAEQSAEFYTKLDNDEIERPDVDKAIAQFKSFADKGKTRRLDFNKFLKYAAVILIPLCIAIFAILQTSDVQDDILASGIETIEPGASRAELLMADGRVLILEQKDTLVRELDGTQIQNLSGWLKYQSNKKIAEKETYNTLMIPRGGEYQLELADGTKVWLNSATSFKYPTKFIGDKRVVYLSGEAYFDVAHNKEMPFIVKVDDMNVKVLGTEFNVKAYPEENLIQTTLVNGKVEVLARGNDNNLKSILSPSYQANYIKGDKTIDVNQVKTNIYTAWKDGLFVLDNINLEELSVLLSRWYDVSFFFTNEKVKQNTFTGKMKKYDNLQDIFDLLEQLSDVEFQVKNNAVIVQERI